jgi:hypothetical protein
LALRGDAAHPLGSWCIGSAGANAAKKLELQRIQSYLFRIFIVLNRIKVEVIQTRSGY